MTVITVCLLQYELYVNVTHWVVNTVTQKYAMDESLFGMYRCTLLSTPIENGGGQMSLKVNILVKPRKPSKDDVNPRMNCHL